MASLLSSLFCCCGGGGARRQPSYREPDERTALLNPDIIPEAPARPVGRTTEEQLAQQEALRRILHDASERFVNIDAPSPFSRPSPDSSPRSSSPLSFQADDDDEADEDDEEADEAYMSTDFDRRDGQRTATRARARRRHPPLVSTPPSAHPRMRHPSGWRPPTDDDPSVKIVHLGTHFEPYQRQDDSSKSSTGTNRIRPTSAHSMRTLPRGSALSARGAAGQQSSPLRPKEASRGDRDGDAGADSQDEGDNGSKYATVASYRTAHEGQSSEQAPQDETRGNPASTRTKQSGDSNTLHTMWDDDQDNTELNKALADLEQSMKTFKLTPVGPIVAELGEVS